MIHTITGLWGKYFILSLRSRRMIRLFEILLFILMAEKAYRQKRVKQCAVRYFLYSYVFWILVSTVFARIHWEVWNAKPVDFSKVNWKLFYSYAIIAEGNKAYLQEVIMNCCMLFPVGFLLPCAWERLRQSSCVMLCLCLSAGIELLQLIYGCGLCELDDIMNNVLGGFLGVLSFKMLRGLGERLVRKLRDRGKRSYGSQSA